MDSNLSLELLSDLKSSYVLFSPLKSAKISLESIFSLHYRIGKTSVPLTLTEKGRVIGLFPTLKLLFYYYVLPINFNFSTNNIRSML